MKLRQLGNTGFEVSEIGLGCWQFGGDFGPIDADTVKGILDETLAQKINFLDTADVYGAGQSETYIGDYLRSSGETPFVATKYGRWSGTYPDGYSQSDLRDSAKRAQDRLQRDSIDLIQLHCVPTELLRRGEIFDWLRTVQQEGHIKFFGASVETIEEALICTEQSDLSSLQLIFNIFRQRIIEEVFPKTIENNIGVIVRLPLASGLLSGKYTKDTVFAESDHRNYNRNGEHFSVGETFAGVPFELGVEFADHLKSLAPAFASSRQSPQQYASS
jgi:aryl-alcohol dehydrogenase-like predicted oxidoreductase